LYSSISLLSPSNLGIAANNLATEEAKHS
jgi:hypothetical protein